MCFDILGESKVEGCVSWDFLVSVGVRPDMRYYFRFGRFRPNPRTKHISDPPRHMTKSYVSYFNMISLMGICPRGNNKVFIILFLVYDKRLFLMLELY